MNNSYRLPLYFVAAMSNYPMMCHGIEYSRQTEVSISILFASNSSAGESVLKCLKSLPADTKENSTKPIATNALQLAERGGEMITLDRRPYIAKVLLEMDESLCHGGTKMDRETVSRKLLYANIYTSPSPKINSLPLNDIILMICIRTYSNKLGFGGTTAENLNTISPSNITLAKAFCKSK